MIINIWEDLLSEMELSIHSSQKMFIRHDHMEIKMLALLQKT